ncbi:hypothetical protein NPIL_331801 [Nephila pilipes]|uniref:Uncharacterized protein n=1 Tax=Nephila pilipes TaxID=299642 RepID=A0A8X6PX33_NEPPI|nr:hypothetical protein NPIL_331801 [Nephila pilipes]
MNVHGKWRRTTKEERPTSEQRSGKPAFDKTTKIMNEKEPVGKHERKHLGSLSTSIKTHFGTIIARTCNEVT